MIKTYSSLHIIFWLSVGLLSACSASAEKQASTQLPDPLAAGWQGQKVCENLHESDTQRVLRCTFAPGVGHERHFHAPHFGYALSGGLMRLTDASGVRHVSIEDHSSYHSQGTAWHEAFNIGDTTVVYLIVEPKQ